MGIRRYKPTSAGRRNMSVATFEEITKSKPEKRLLAPLRSIPLGTQVHNIELELGRGGVMVRSAGVSAQLMAKEGNSATLRMPSGEMRIVHIDCLATIGQVGNLDHQNIRIGKAGRKRWMGRRPEVRGSVMNPRDHPHGGGEGRSPRGMPPKTKWGKPARGVRTRHNPRTNRFIVRRRKP